MAPERAFRLVNVFAAGTPLSGNTLCVIEDATGLSDAEMQALALQFNLSETAFVLPSSTADARVRIFSPGGELPFAGHPVLGTASVVAERLESSHALRLELSAGVIPVALDGDRVTLDARAPRWREPSGDRGELADMLGLVEADVAPGALYVDTGIEHLLVPLASESALRRVRPDARRAAAHANDRSMIKICGFVDDGGGEVAVRFFSGKAPGVLVEDPGTGSACANVGGWWIAQGCALPRSATLLQGDHLGRACRLGLAVGTDRSIRVSGRVVQIARGVLQSGS